MAVTVKRAGHTTGSQNGMNLTIDGLSTVAETGDYSDLTNKPTIPPAAITQLTGAVTAGPGSGSVATTLATIDLRGAGKYTVDDQVADATGSVYCNMNTDNAFTATGFGATMGPAWLRLQSNGTTRMWVDWSAGSAVRFYAPGRMDFETASNIYFTGSTFQFQAHSSFNRVGDAASTATQKDSYGLYLQNSLWTGSASTQRHSLIRSKASTSTNLAHRMAFYLNVTGGLGTEGTEVMALDFDGTLYQAHFKAKFGYPTGQGGTVTQATNKSTAVTLSKLTGQITMNGASLGADTTVSFTLTNTLIESGDHVIVTHRSAGTGGAYSVTAFPGSGSAVVYVRNVTSGALSEAIVLQVTVIKGATA